jgi:hypothetical protein
MFLLPSSSVSPNAYCAPFGREQDTRLGKRNPSSLVRWQWRQGASKRTLRCSIEFDGIVSPKSQSDKAHYSRLESLLRGSISGTGRVLNVAIGRLPGLLRKRY